MTFFSFPSNTFLNNSIKFDLSKYPNIFCAFSILSSIPFFVLTSALSKSERASLTEPSDILTISFKASYVTVPFSFLFIIFINFSNSKDFTLDKSYL